MAETFAVFMKLDGTDVAGYTSVSSQGREGSMEGLRYESSVKTVREGGSAMATGRRQYEPCYFWKRIDNATPLLYQGLVDNKVVECVFKFFRPNPTTGESEQFYTITLAQGRIASIEQSSPDSLNPQDASVPPIEKVGVVFHTITWSENVAGVEHTDTWGDRK